MKNKKNYFLIFLFLLFIAFLALYLSGLTGYYEYREYNKMIITKEAMEKFEQDVSEGKNVSIEEYITSNYKDYSNSISRLGLKTGEFINNFINKGIKGGIKVIKALFID